MPSSLSLRPQRGRDVVDQRLALAATPLDQVRDLAVRPGMQRLERQVLELPLHLLDAQAVRERRVDLQRLGRDPALLLGREHATSVRMLCRRSASLISRTRMSPAIATIILRTFSACSCSRVRNSIRSSLVSPSTMRATSVAELLLDLVDGDVGVLDRVVQERGRERRRVQVQVAPGSCATAIGCSMKSSPDIRFCPSWDASANGVGPLDLLEVGLRVVAADELQQRLDARGRVGLARDAGARAGRHVAVRL